MIDTKLHGRLKWIDGSAQQTLLWCQSRAVKLAKLECVRFPFSFPSPLPFFLSRSSLLPSLFTPLPLSLPSPYPLSLLSSVSHPLSPSISPSLPSFPFPTSKRPPQIQLWGLGERCKLPQRGPGRSRGR